MTGQREPTLKQWKRRALAAEQQVEFLQNVRAMESASGLRQFRELAALRVALAEIAEIAQWAKEQRHEQ
jgi:hypothetical protein